MMDLPGIDLAKRGENVYCHRNVKDIRIEHVKKWSHQQQQQKQPSENGQHILANEFASSARNRTTVTALLLYISYTLSIHLLWTNCVIFTEPAQLNLNVNSSWNSLLQNQHQHQQHPLPQQRTESNRSLNSNNSSHNNSKFNFGNVPSHSQSIRVRLNGTFHQSDASQVEFLPNFPAFAANREFASSSAEAAAKTLQPIDVNHTITGNEVVSPANQTRAKHFYTINRLKRTSSLTRQPHNIQHHQPPSISASASTITSTHSSKRNEFRRSSDEIRFKRYQSESENVIKSVKNHAIKRNVNTFTPAILGDNSNLSIINAVTVQPKTIKPSSSIKRHELITKTTEATATITTTTTAAISVASTLSSSTMASMVADAKSILNAHDLATNLATATTEAAVTAAIRHNQLNQTVSGDSKLKANNSTAINRMENNRNNSRIMGNSNVFGGTTGASVTPTINPTRRHFSSSAPTPSRFRVNDVFEMDTKQKYYNATHRQNRDNQVTSMDGDDLNKWHVQHRNGKRIISLLGLFELSTRNGLRVEGLSELKAAELAVRHINKRDHLLPGYTLQLITNDTKVCVIHRIVKSET